MEIPYTYFDKFEQKYGEHARKLIYTLEQVTTIVEPMLTKPTFAQLLF